MQCVQIYDDDTGDLIDLLDDDGNAAFAIALEIEPSHRHGYSGPPGPSPYYDWASEAVLHAYLAQGSAPQSAGNWLSIVDDGTINIQIPKSRMETLRRTGTYDVFLRIDDTANDDGRQILIGRLPVFAGGRGACPRQHGSLP